MFMSVVQARQMFMCVIFLHAHENENAINHVVHQAEHRHAAHHHVCASDHG
ncbi:MAG: hypothetical protein L3J17_10260 [Candidatus Jettenia sp.]|nr:MAG: hypothetical protein L3J17_10260 [Candidatus Jettenia sp.]